MKNSLLPENKQKSLEIQSLFADLIKKYEMSIAIVDLNNPNGDIFGYNLDHFIYPASVYKIFIGAEVLRRVEIGDFTLDQIIEIKSPNDVDKDARIFPGDTRKLLYTGEKVTIDYLLNLMLTRSDNTASNCLIDLVGRESITENIIYKNNWQGSEVTRKFLDRIKENKEYQFSSTTMSCARHLAEFFYLVENEKLVSPFVSQKLKEYMLQFNKQGKQGAYIPDGYDQYYCKGGWLETNLYKHNPLSFVKAILKKGWAIIRWSNDAGVVTIGNKKYVIVIMSVTKTISPWKYFPIKGVAKKILKYMH
jgi:hypothetical protein